MANNYKVKMKDIQNKYKFKIFCAGYEYDDTEIRNAINQRALITETGRYIELELNPNTYVLTAKLKDKNNNLINTSTPIDLPLESMIVDCDYDATTKSLIITLQNGNTTTIPLGDLISGLATEEDLEEMDAKVSANIKKISDLENELNQYKMLENALPKVEGEGESITLDGTAQTPMHLNFKGQIQQDSTSISGGDEYDSPSPDHPQPIHIVSGDNEIKVCNKNLFIIENYSKTGWNITIDNPLKGLSTGDYTISCVNKYITANKGMAIEFSNGGDNIGYFVGYDFGNTLMNKTTNITQDMINANYLVFMPQDSLCTQEVLESMQIMITKGTDTSYVEHQEYTKEINLPVENLYNPEQTLSRGQYASGVWQNVNTRITSDYIEIEKGKSYTIFCDLDNLQDVALINYNLFDSQKNWLGARAENGDSPFLGEKTHSFKINLNNSKYLRISFVKYSNGEQPITPSMVQNSIIQLEKGSKANSYTPYGTTPIEVGSKGEYEDEFFKNITNSEYYDSTLLKDKWYLKKRIQKTIITEDNKDIIGDLRTQNNHSRILINKSNLGFNTIYATGVALLNKYKEVVSASEVNTGCFATNFTQNALTIWNDDFTDLTTARNLLIGTEIYIVKATPENILLNDTLQETLDSFYSMQEQTNISQENNDLPFVIKASAIYDLNDLITRVATLETE